MKTTDLRHIEEYKEAHEDLLELLEMFPQEKLEEALFDGNSIKTLVRQTTLAAIFLIALLEDFQEGRELVWEDPYEEELSPVAYADAEWEDLYDDLRVSGDRLFEVFEDFSEDLWDAKIWKERTLTPRKMVEIDTDHYRNNLIEEIAKHIPLEEF